MPSIFHNPDDLASLRSQADRGDQTAQAIMAIMDGTRWVSITAAAEASDTIRATGQVKDQDGQNVSGVQNVVIESFNAAGGALAAVRLATAAPLDACTAAGTGATHTLTGDANGALTVDGVAAVVADRVLVKDQVAGDDNGIYTVTAAGAAGAVFVLTRAADFDTAAEMKKGLLIPVTLGTANTGKTFKHTTATAITVETTALTFADAVGSTAADLGGMVVATVGTMKAGSGTAKVWMATSATGAFNVDIKNVTIGDVLLRVTTDNGEVEQVLLTYA